MKRIASSLLLAALTALTLPTHAGDIDAATLERTVSALGTANGQALACGHTDVAARARQIMIARVPKSRRHGETFETATQAAFLDQGKAQAGCPDRLALTVQLDQAAKPLAPPSAHALLDTTETPEAGLNPRYLLQAANGRAIMDGDFRQQFQLITFGYTFCPDVCPTSLSEMAAILKALGDDAARVQALFFSLDPERDTLAHLRSYTGYFDARIIAATGKPELVRHAAKNFKVQYEKVVEPGTAANHYAIDHTAGMFLLAPGGQFLAKFPYGTPVDAMVKRLREEIALRPPVDATAAPR